MPKYDVGELITALNEAVNKLNILCVKYNDLEKTRDAIQAENEKLRAALQSARRDAREQVARYHDLMAKMAGSSTELQRRSLWVHSESAKDIRSGIDIRVLGEKE